MNPPRKVRLADKMAEANLDYLMTDIYNRIGSGGAGGIADAPSDSVLYGRENAAWVAIPTTAAIFLKARAYKDGVLSLSAGDNLVTIDTISYDPYSIVDLITSRFIPKKVGYYITYGQVIATGTGQITLVLEGTPGVTFGSTSYDPVTSTMYATAQDIRYFNGTTDYMELHVIDSAGGDVLSTGTAAANFMTIVGPF